jgi:poly-beta-1,6-N-acetyl-D-glucosamine synthase
MKGLFWFSAAWIAYTYVGYPCWLWLRVLIAPQPVRRSPNQPKVSLVMVVRNEAAGLRQKIENLLALDYPPELCRIVVVSDGSTDQTEEILNGFGGDARICTLYEKTSAGKAAGLNAAMRRTRDEIVVFTDVRQKIEPTALRLLMENFAEAEIGAASGELMLGDPQSGESARGMGIYWRIEKRVRELESASGSVVGATGALYAVRRELVPEVPSGTILDDVFIPMTVVRRGFRVVFDSRARAWDVPDLGGKREFHRKVRTLTGNYQLLRLAPWLLGKENPIRFELVSHKLMRLAIPLALVVLAVTATFLPGPLYRACFGLQVLFYALSLLGWRRWNLGPLSRACDAAYTFVALNAAAVLAFVNFLKGNNKVWTPPVQSEVKA